MRVSSALPDFLAHGRQGANWSAYATNLAEQERERATFHHFDRLAKTDPEMVRRTPFVYVAGKDLYGEAWYKDLVYNVRLPPPALTSVALTLEPG